MASNSGECCPACGSDAAVHLCDADTALYEQMLLNLLPRGAAWPRHPDSMVYKLYAKGLTGGFTLVHERVCASLREVWPCDAKESLERWAAIFGLEECDNSAAELLADCTELEVVQQALKARVCSHWSMTLGGAPSMVELAASYGIVIEPIPMGSGYGDQVYGGPVNGLCAGSPFGSTQSIDLREYGQEWRSIFGENIDPVGQYKAGRYGAVTYAGPGGNVDVEYPDPANPMPPPVDVYRVTDVGEVLLPRYGCAPHGAPYGIAQNAAIFFCAATKIANAGTITCFI